VRELRQHASRYLDLVKAGETVEVTERGELVAVLAPPSPATTARGRLTAAVRLTWPEVLGCSPARCRRPPATLPARRSPRTAPARGDRPRHVGTGRAGGFWRRGRRRCRRGSPLSHDAWVASDLCRPPHSSARRQPCLRRRLRSPDAIHLATAAALGPELTAFLVHDDRLTAAAIRAAPPVARPA
jgi:prevent-host-death family protein